MGGNSVERFLQFDTRDFNKEAVVAVVKLKVSQIRRGAIGKNDQVQVGDTVGFQIIPKRLIVDRQAQPEN